MRWIVAPSAPEKSNGILCAAQQKLKMLRVASVLQYDHHSISEAWLPCNDHIAICSVCSASLQRAFESRPRLLESQAFCGRWNPGERQIQTAGPSRLARGLRSPS